MLKRVFIGWLGSEPDHCCMVGIPTLEEKDAKRPNRERENLAGERTRPLNQTKACLARLGTRNFKSTLRKAPEGLKTLRTPEGELLPLHMPAERLRDIARLRRSWTRSRRSTVHAFSNSPSPGTFAEPLTEVLRDGAQALLARLLGRGFGLARLLCRQTDRRRSLSGCAPRPSARARDRDR
jgi:hypothetical protein